MLLTKTCTYINFSQLTDGFQCNILEMVEDQEGVVFGIYTIAERCITDITYLKKALERLKNDAIPQAIKEIDIIKDRLDKVPLDCQYVDMAN